MVELLPFLHARVDVPHLRPPSLVPSVRGGRRLRLVTVHEAVQVHDLVADETPPSQTTQRLDVAQVVVQPDQNHQASAVIATA